MSSYDPHNPEGNRPPPFPNSAPGHNQPPPPPPPPHYNYGAQPPPPPPYPPYPKMGGTFLQSCAIAGCVTIFVPVLIILGFFILMGFLASSVKDSAGGAFSDFYQVSGAGRNLRERVVRPGDLHAGTIALVTLSGVISGGGSPLNGDGTLEYFAEQLRAASENETVKAVILQIDSPGGGLTPSDQLHHEVELFRKSGKPVLAWAGSMMTSGGYYIAVAADEIMANPTATLGSIGVILQHFQAQELLEKLGLKANPITSGEHKDIGSPFREMTPDEKRILQEYVDMSFQRFVDVVAKGRNMPADKVRELADGRIYGAEQAKTDGLVDSIGYMDDAVRWIEKKTGEENMRVIAYKRVVSFADLFGDAGASAGRAFAESLRNEARTSAGGASIGNGR